MNRTLQSLLLGVVFMLSTAQGGLGNKDTVGDYVSSRNAMVDHQIRARGVGEPRVLAAMRKVERHLFVAPEMRWAAYEDHPLPIGEDQTISQPYIVALMSEEVASRNVHRVLEVGTGSGYQAAVLAEFCDSVFTIEINEHLAAEAAQRLRALGYRNIVVRHGDGYEGWAEHAPFDGILVTCAPTRVPKPLIDQLAEGGVMVIPVGGGDVQMLDILHKIGGRMQRVDSLEVRFVPMIDKKGNQY